MLRILTTGELLRVGSTTVRQVDVRIIAATHRDLLERVKDGTFREDLYYRLAVFPVHVPPLRERLADLDELVLHFVRIATRNLSVAPRRISPEALASLRGYSFPGNIRELRNLIERALIISRSDTIGRDDLPLPSSSRAPASDDPIATLASSLPAEIDLRSVIGAIEEALVERALERANGVQAEAARLLGLSRSDVNYRLRHRSHER
jgi:transcriptional regulator with GAF, ATPase, and Fis domain